jgi:cation:H+ antiporter
LSWQAAGLFLLGLALVIAGAELIVRAATRVAVMLNVKPLLIGLTVVAIGTSTPELAVGITASLEGRGALAVGNIAGTNIVNILFILGLSALLRPLPLQLLSIKLDLPVMVAAAMVLVLMAADGRLSRTEGMILALAAVAYTVTLLRLSRREASLVKKEFATEYSAAAVAPGSGVRAVAWQCALLLAGLAVIVVGADMLVSGATRIARLFGVSDAIIGLTIVAIGTSAPELATTVVSTLRNERDVAVGNLIGSSIYNIFAILGVTVLASPGGIAVSREILLIDLPLAALVALVCVPVFRSGNSISRAEGGGFVLAYLVYLGTLVLIRA